VLRINRRWIDEVVVRFGVCPFAAASLASGAVARRVLDGLDDAPSVIDAWARDPSLEIGLIIFPRLRATADAFDRACAPLRTANPAFVAAVFHPDTPFDAATAAQAVGYFRRAPDPTLQLVRASVLERVRGPDGKFLFDFSPAAWAELKKREQRLPTSQRIARDNHALLAARHAELATIYDDIRADRERSYRRGG
jgi:hypothetical protein